MAYTNDQIIKAKKAKSVEELLAMAKAENVPMTEAVAQKIYDALHKEGELSDDELDSVAGGKGREPVIYRQKFTCPYCGCESEITYCDDRQDKEYCDCGAWIYMIPTLGVANYCKGASVIDVSAH